MRSASVLLLLGIVAVIVAAQSSQAPPRPPQLKSDVSAVTTADINDGHKQPRVLKDYSSPPLAAKELVVAFVSLKKLPTASTDLQTTVVPGGTAGRLDIDTHCFWVVSVSDRSIQLDPSNCTYPKGVNGQFSLTAIYK